MNTSLHWSQRIRRPRRSSRGVAFLEAILVLPVWILLFAGLLFGARLARTSLELSSERRACVHLLSRGGCLELPEDCKEISAPTPRGEAERSRRAARKVVSEFDSSARAETTREVERALDSLATPQATSLSSRKIPRPELLGGGTRVSSGETRLPCAPHEAQPTNNLAKNLFRSWEAP